jgi:hypothetical protein
MAAVDSRGVELGDNRVVATVFPKQLGDNRVVATDTADSRSEYKDPRLAGSLSTASRVRGQRRVVHSVGQQVAARSLGVIRFSRPNGS